jgi:predicted PurR-regulated permease PerM
VTERVSDRVSVAPSRTTLLFVTAAAVVIVIGGIKAANHIVAPVMLSLSLVIVVHPLRARLERHMPRWAASIVVLVTTVMLILSLAIAVAVSLGQLAKLVPTYATEMNGYVDDIGDALKKAGVGSDQSDAMVSSADVGKLVDLVTSILSSVLGVLTSLFFIVTLLAFLAFDSAKTERLAAGARRHRPYLVDALASFARGTRSYLGVSAVFGLIVAVIDTALLYLLGVPGAFVWGVLAFVTNFIPNIGFIIGIIPPALIALLEGGPSLMIEVIVLYCLVNLVLQSFIQPRYVGVSVGLTTSLTFLSLMFWTWVLGPVGALLAVPMSLLFRAILIEADPDGAWRLPLVSGIPDDEPATT